MDLNRRHFLKGLGVGGLSLTFAGLASANSGDAQYVLLVNGNARRRLEREGYSVRQELADGDVLVVHGPEDADPRSVRGVGDAYRDVRLELERPAESSIGDGSDIEPPTFYDFLWDKQVTESLEANQYATGDGSAVAVIDTGCDYVHPDLVPNLDTEAGRLFRKGDRKEGVEDGIVVARPVDEDEYDDEDDGPTFEIETVEQHVADDVQGHGTHVGGIAAASADGGVTGTGVTGTAPDATLVSLRVFWWETVDEDANSPDERWAPITTIGDILAAIDYASTQGYDAANLSLGTLPLPPQTNTAGIRAVYERVIARATQRGTLVVASVGNSDANLQQGGYFTLPNSTAGAISVSASTPNDERAFYSNFGTNEVDVGAPGGGYETLEKTLGEDPDVVDWPFPSNLVLSTTSPRVEGAPYGWKAGTSMAAPQVAGLAALVRELDEEADGNRVENALKHGAEKATGRSDPNFGAGRINALKTVEWIDGGDDD